MIGMKCEIVLAFNSFNFNIIKEINIKRSFYPDNEKINIFEKRYNVWKNIYSSNTKISASFL